MAKGIIFDWTGTLYERGKGLFSFSEKVLQELKAKGYVLGLVSLAGKGVNCDIERREKEIENTGITHYFDSVVIDVVKGKEQFLKCFDEMGISPENSIAIDDRMSRGIKAGIELGCKTFWIQIGDRSFDSPTEETGEPDYKIDTIKELGELLE